MPVFGLLKRGGKVYTAIIPNAHAATLLPIIREKVMPDSIVYTDSFQVYDVLDVSEFHHRRVTTAKCSSTNEVIISTGLRTFGAKPSGICAASTASLETVFIGFGKSVTGGSMGAAMPLCCGSSNRGIGLLSIALSYFSPKRKVVGEHCCPRGQKWGHVLYCASTRSKKPRERCT